MGNDFTSDRRTVLRSLAGLAALGGAGVQSVGASETRDFEPLGFTNVDGAAEAVASEDGQVAYVAFSDGFASVDISDPASPSVLATRTDTGISGALDVKQNGDRVAFVGPGNRAGSVNGMGLYDVSDPADPQQLALFETDYSIHNAFLTDDVAYLIDNGAAEIVLVDVSDDDPQELSRWGLDGARTLHDHWVQDGVAYLNFWNDGTVMLDVSDPANPTSIGKVRDGSGRGGNNDHYVTVNDDASIIGIGKEQLGSYSNLGVELWDISDKRDTEFLAEIEPPADPAGEERTSHNFDIQGDYLYTSWYRGGIRVHDIGDPANPEQIASWQGDGTSMWTAEVAVPGESVIASDEAISGGNGRLYTFPDPAQRSQEPPTATIDVSPADPVAGEEITFDGTASTDPDGTIASYEWTLDGDVVSTEPSDTFTLDAGEYAAGLTVTDDDGLTDSASATLTVGEAPNEGPVARIDVSPADPDVGEEVTFDGTGSTDPDGTIASYEWTLDGDVVSTEPSDTFTLDEAGEYTAGLTVTDDDGKSDATSATLTVGEAPNEGPTARVDVSPAEPVAGEEITFDGTGSTDPDGTITSYEWTLDGDVVSEEPSDTFTLDAGEYAAGLTVTDDDGKSDSTEATLTVDPDDGGQCGGETDGGSTSGWLGWWNSGDTYSYSTRTSNPCEITVALDGSRGNDFDLYVTYDGRTPTTDDFDDSSTTPDANEQIVADLDGGTEIGILVDRYSGWGSYELSVEELGR